MGTQHEHEYRIEELERKVAGLQRQVSIQRAIQDKDRSDTHRRLRDLEIKAAVERGVPQKEVAQIYDLSAARVSQIYREARKKA
ncbi:sigma factor-like helix-turn-helix DNA-binding protein [Aeromonas caviae]|uniref:sigma factor-like helix-turn-helix DNA-binding protein n=1 Tax=Aeromonas sp. R5-2 TaxID=3138468 RepID=UPI0034A58B48